MPNCLLKPLAIGLLIGKILEAAPAAIPIRWSTNDKHFLSGTLTIIEKSIQSTARTFTNTRLKDEIRSETVLHKAGLCSLTQAVSESMAILIWKARKEINPFGRMFQNYVFERYKDNLLKPIPGYPKAASNK